MRIAGRSRTMLVRLFQNVDSPGKVIDFSRMAVAYRLPQVGWRVPYGCPHLSDVQWLEMLPPHRTVPLVVSLARGSCHRRKSVAGVNTGAAVTDHHVLPLRCIGFQSVVRTCLPSIREILNDNSQTRTDTSARWWRDAGRGSRTQHAPPRAVLRVDPLGFAAVRAAGLAGSPRTARQMRRPDAEILRRSYVPSSKDDLLQSNATCRRFPQNVCGAVH